MLNKKILELKYYVITVCFFLLHILENNYCC